MKFKVRSSIFLFMSLESSLYKYNTISIEQERCLEGCRFGQMVVTIPKLQREDFAVECQMTGKATKNAPYPQCHHSLGTLGSLYP